VPLPSQIVFDVGVAVQVPPPGQSGSADLLTLAGGQSLIVHSDADAGVTVENCGPDDGDILDDSGYTSSTEAPPPAAPGDPPPPQADPPPAALDGSASNAETASASSPDSCKDRAYNLYKGKPRWTSRMEWYLNTDTTPAELTRANALSDLTAGFRAIVNAQNPCGLVDDVQAQQAYMGSTNRRTGIAVTNNGNVCPKADRNSYNVVDFGPLADPGRNKLALGLDCGWWIGNSKISDDIRFVKNVEGSDSWFTGSVPSGCTAAFSLKGVAAHEAGHAFGLSHVAENTHGNLTMSGSSPRCSSAQSTLGRGDVLGLRQLYR
jgi:hypothetical protein